MTRTSQPTAKKKFISIVTVVRDDVEGLARTFASVRAQACGDFEYIVIDGNSRDGSVELIRKHGDLVDDWVSEADSGIYDAMNKGLCRATGEFILFMNAGDVFQGPASLAKVEIAARRCREDLLYFQAVSDKGAASRFGQPSAVRFDSVGNHQATVIRTARHKRFPFDTRYRIKADRDVQLRLTQAGAAAVSIAQLVAEVDGGGISATNIVAKEWENLLICWRNRVGLPWMSLAVGLAIARVAAHRVSRWCQLDWAAVKRFCLDAIARPALQMSVSR